MRKRRISFILLALLLVAAMLLSACGGAKKVEEPADTNSTEKSSTAEPEPKKADDGPLTKYDPTITLTTIRGIEPSRTFMPGETWDNNIWTKAFEEKLGIKFNYLWTCPATEFEQKVNVAIASDELPELMCIKYDQFYRLAAAGKLADITDAFDKYAGESLRRNMTEIANGVGLEMDKYKGKLYGIGDPPGYALSGHMLWFRDDWVRNVGAQNPKTWDDVINLMYAFTKNDPNKNGKPTYGMGVDKSLFDTGTGLEGFFAAYNAYPWKMWIEKDGKLEYGGIQPECKEALAMLQKLFNDGIIDKEFAIKGEWDNYPDDMIQDKVGLEFGPVWVGDWTPGDIMVNHPKEATWTCMEIPSAKGGIAKRPVQGKQNNVTCMRADTKHPEAMIKILNLGKALMTDEGTAEGKYHDQKDGDQTVNNFFHYQDLFSGGDNVNWNYECAVKVTEALASKDPSKLNDEQKSYYDRSVAYLEGTDMKGYRSLKEFGPDGAQTLWYKSWEAGNTLPNAFYGPNTDTMNAKLGNLEQKLKEIFTKIIMGSPMDEFDKWVKYFNDQGGAEITKEVNDWYAEVKK